MSCLLSHEPAGAQDKDGAESSVFGRVQLETAYTYADPTHWSKVRGRFDVGARGAFGESVKWKVSGVGLYDAAYDLEDAHYTADARHELRKLFDWRETYLDWSVGDAAIRIGRQHIVWGEMVTLFVADVVSARDLTEFVLPEFDQIRIPQWALRGEYFLGDAHLEAVWIPYPSFDRIGKPNGDFYPYPVPVPGFGFAITDEVIPSRKAANSNYGVRASGLFGGWDLSGFYYRSMDAAPTFYRSFVPEFVVTGVVPTAVFEPRHDRIWQVGGTFSKDLEGWVLKGEGVFTRGRKLNTVELHVRDGLVASDIFDWVVGLDFTPADDWRVNTQLFQRVYLDHDPGILFDRYEWGGSLLVNRRLGGRWEVEALAAAGFNRSDWMLRPAVIWNADKNWRLKAGIDVFGGSSIGFFGRFDASDRVYAEVRYTF